MKKTNIILSVLFVLGMATLGVLSYHQEEGKELGAIAWTLLFAFLLPTAGVVASLIISERKESKKREEMRSKINKDYYRPEEDLHI